MNGTQLSVCSDDVNLFRNNINIIKKNTEALLDDTKDVDLELYAEETK